MTGRSCGLGVVIDPSVYDGLPASFVAWYRDTFTGTRMVYGHWSGGVYTRAVGSYHRQVAVLRPTDLDEMLERCIDARARRVGGAISSMLAQLDEMKAEAKLQVFENAPWDRDLADHTRGRETGSVAIALMCGRGARPNDLGLAAPLRAQLRALVGLVAEACDALRTPVERFMTHSEAADNLDFPTFDDPDAPTPPYGFRTTREACDLEAWIDVVTEALSPPLVAPRPGLLRLAEWVRAKALHALAERTRSEWDKNATTTRF